MALAKELNISNKNALDLFYRSKTCDELHNPETWLYTFSDSYIAEEVIDEMREK
jgi:hypothetical protein